jgi:uncharacterized protein HemY
MFKLLAYVVVIAITLFGVYAFIPESGIVEITSDNYYVSGSITMFFVFAVFFVLSLFFLISFMLWILRLPSSMKSVLDSYFYRKKVEKMLDIIYLIETGKDKEACSKYKEKDFILPDHPMVELVKKKIEKKSEQTN